MTVFSVLSLLTAFFNDSLYYLNKDVSPKLVVNLLLHLFNLGLLETFIKLAEPCLA